MTDYDRGVEQASTVYTKVIRAYAAENAKLKAENDRLRELVRKIEHYEQEGCYKCAYYESCYAGSLYDESCTMSAEIGREKRELGVEVDNG